MGLLRYFTDLHIDRGVYHLGYGLLVIRAKFHKPCFMQKGISKFN